MSPTMPVVSRLDPAITPELPQPDRVLHPEVAPPEVPQTGQVEEPPAEGGSSLLKKAYHGGAEKRVFRCLPRIDPYQKR